MDFSNLRYKESEKDTKAKESAAESLWTRAVHIIFIIISGEKIQSNLMSRDSFYT